MEVRGHIGVYLGELIGDMGFGVWARGLEICYILVPLR